MSSVIPHDFYLVSTLDQGLNQLFVGQAIWMLDSPRKHICDARQVEWVADDKLVIVWDNGDESYYSSASLNFNRQAIYRYSLKNIGGWDEDFELI